MSSAEHSEPTSVELSGGAPKDWDISNVSALSRMKLYDARTSIIINRPADLDLPDRTYVIGGNGRGGTSMVAGVAHLLGLELNPSGPGNLESRPIVALARGRNPENSLENLDLSRDEIMRRLGEQIDAFNAKDEVWGWKDPSAENYILDILGHIRNLHLIVVFRDPVAVATALLGANDTARHRARIQSEYQGPGALAAEDAFRTADDRYTRYWNLALELGCPTLLVSYERGRANPEQLAAEMAEFLGMPITPEIEQSIVRYVSPKGGYLKTTSAMSKELKVNPIASVISVAQASNSSSQGATAESDLLELLNASRAENAQNVIELNRIREQLAKVKPSIETDDRALENAQRLQRIQAESRQNYLALKAAQQEAAANYSAFKAAQSEAAENWDALQAARDEALRNYDALQAAQAEAARNYAALQTVQAEAHQNYDALQAVKAEAEQNYAALQVALASANHPASGAAQ